MNRRRILRLIVGVAVVGSAGCIEGDDPTEGNEESSDTEEDGGSTATGTQEEPPSVDCGWEGDPPNDAVILSHNGGERIDTSEKIRPTGDLASNAPDSLADTLDSGAMTAGDTTGPIPVSVDEGTIEIEWEASDGSMTQVLDAYDYDLS